jgi:hypothetical protein
LLPARLSPVSREAAGAGGDEDGLAEAFEEEGDFGQALLAGVHFGQEGFQLGDDAALFGERGERDLEVSKNPKLQLALGRAKLLQTDSARRNHPLCEEATSTVS